MSVNSSYSFWWSALSFLWFWGFLDHHQQIEQFCPWPPVGPFLSFCGWTCCGPIEAVINPHIGVTPRDASCSANHVSRHCLPTSWLCNHAHFSCTFCFCCDFAIIATLFRPQLYDCDLCDNCDVFSSLDCTFSLCLVSDDFLAILTFFVFFIHPSTSSLTVDAIWVLIHTLFLRKGRRSLPLSALPDEFYLFWTSLSVIAAVFKERL